MQNYIDHELIIVTNKHGQWIVLLRYVITAAQLSSAPPGPSVAIGMLSGVSSPLTHFLVLAAASSPRSDGKSTKSHDTVCLLTEKDEGF